MKKRSVSHKKRTARRRKQQRSKKRQRSLQQRLARLAKAQRPFNSLVAALAKASASAVTLVESEKLRQLPRLGKAVLNINLDTQDAPNYLQMQPPAAQRSLQGSLSLLQRLTSILQVESSVLCRETALRWVVPRRTWPLSVVGCRIPPPECTPHLLTHAGELILSQASYSPLLAPTLPTDSRSIAVEPQAEKRFQEELPIPGFSPGAPAARWTAAYQQAPAAAPKAASAAPVADTLPGAEQPSSDDGIGEVGHEAALKPQFHPRGHRQNQKKWKGYKSHRANRPLRKNSRFVSKPFYPAKKRSFQKNFSNLQKNYSCLGRSAGPSLRIGGWLPTSAKVYCRQCGSKVIVEYGNRQFGLSESPRANCTDSHRLPSPAAAVPVCSFPSGYIPEPTPEDACYNAVVAIAQLTHCMVMTGCFREQAEWMTGVVSPGYEAMEEIYSYINRHLASHQSLPAPSGVDY